jgi:hypothetical protein
MGVNHKLQTGKFHHHIARLPDLFLWKWLNQPFNLFGLLISLTLFAAVSAVFLKSRVFVAGVMLNDTLLFTEAGYRVAHGQLPGIDFTNAYSALWYLPHAIAYKLTGDLVWSVPIAFCIFAAAVFILAAYIAWTRLSFIVGVLTVVSTSIFVMAPWAIGFKVSTHGSTLTTGAEAYNRLGLALVLLATLLAVTRKAHRRRLTANLDAVFAVACFGLAFYTKMPFGLGVAGMVLLSTLLLAGDKWQFLKFAGGAAILVGMVGFLVPGLNTAYVEEMMIYAQIRSALDVTAIARLAYEASPEILATAVLPMAALAASGRCDWRKVVYGVCLVGGSTILVAQSFQGPYLIAPGALAIIALSELTGEREQPLPRPFAISTTAIAFAFSLLTYFAPAVQAILRHAWFAGRSAAIDNMPASYAALRVPPDMDLKAMDAAFAGTLSGAQGYAVARSKETHSNVNPLFEDEYAHTLTDLTNARNLCGRARDRTAILDFTNVSPSLLGHPPVSGYVYAHWDRGFSQDVHWPPERMFSGVDCLFDPKLPDVPSSRDGLWIVYGSTISSSFSLAGETAFWRVFVRNGAR